MEDQPPAEAVGTGAVTIDKSVVKEALTEILMENPAFKAFVSKQSPTDAPVPKKAGNSSRIPPSEDSDTAKTSGKFSWKSYSGYLLIGKSHGLFTDPCALNYIGLSFGTQEIRKNLGVLVARH